MDQDFSLDQQTGNGEVRIGDHWFPLNGGVSEQPLARWPPKVTFGDYAKDSDPLISAYVMSSFTGGIGNYSIKAGVEDDTYWTGTLESRFHDGLTLLPLTESFGSDHDSYTTSRPLGDFPASDPQYLHCFDADVHSWDESTEEFTFEISLAATPVDRGVEYLGEFWVPYGAGGYGVLDSALALTEHVDISPIQFIVWDKKLMALTTNGELRQWHTTDLDWSVTAWTATGENRTLPTGNDPRRMVNFMNTSGVPTLHITTNTLVFAYDPDSDVLYETRLDYPKHPDQGKAAVNWRGDTMFVSVGLGIHGYNGSIITSMGPDGRHGLPDHLRGSIVDLAAEYNGLLALIEGRSNPDATEVSEEFISQNPMYGNEDTWAISDLPLQPVYSSIYRWSNSQWHPVWESAGASGTPTSMSISEADDSYRLWWGYGAEAYTQRLQVDFQNPKQSLLSLSLKFAPSGELTTGWFDADMTAFYKLASHIEVTLDDVFENGQMYGAVSVYYQIDVTSGWKLLGTATGVGRTNMPFGNVLREVGPPFSKGKAFRKIRFRIVMTQLDESQDDDLLALLSALLAEILGDDTLSTSRFSPLLESIVFKFNKIPEQTLSWQFSISLVHPDGYKGVGNDELIQYLYNLLVTDEFFEFGYRGDTFRVRAAQTTGERGSGYDERGNFQMNLVQITTGPSQGNSVTVYTDFT
jgi:hypothetical protein